MMALLKLYLSPALLLLLGLTCPMWQVGMCVPLMTHGHMTDDCVFQARMLLTNITDVLTNVSHAELLFRGLNCTQPSIELNTGTNTPTVCAPKESQCSGVLKAEFDQDSCLNNIKEDLHYYYKFLGAQMDPNNVLSSTMRSLEELMQNCFAWSQPPQLAQIEAPADNSKPFDRRLSLCKVLRGFQVRTITINRVIGYLNSGKTH